jgi:hypothetical protein
MNDGNDTYVVSEGGTPTGAHDSAAGAIDQARADLDCGDGGKVTYSYDETQANIKAEGEYGGQVNITHLDKG